MPRTAISTPHAPGAIGPYSQAIRADGYLYCSGQLGLARRPASFVRGTSKRRRSRRSGTSSPCSRWPA